MGELTEITVEGRSYVQNNIEKLRIINCLRLRLSSAHEGSVDFKTDQDYKGLNNRFKRLGVGGLKEFFKVRTGLLDLHITTAATIWANALYEPVRFGGDREMYVKDVFVAVE